MLASISIEVGSTSMSAKDQDHIKALLNAERLRIEALVAILHGRGLINESERTALLAVGMSA